VTRGAVVFAYEYDASGNMMVETTSRHFEWDHANRLRVFRTQVQGSEPTVYARSFYDAAGRLIKKLVRKPGGIVEVTVYIDGVFELRRITRVRGIEQNDTLHVQDGSRRIAEVRIGNAFADDATPAVKFHLGDHLDSSNLVLDGAGALVNGEEYTPFGETSFGSFRYKRYRFGGHERDDASGLYPFGARHYAPWLGRWISADPAGPVDGSNLFAYVRNNPINRADPSGTDSESKDNGYRDAGAGPTDVSGAEAQEAKPPTSTEDTYSSSQPDGKTVTPYDLPDAKIAGAVGAGGVTLIPRPPPGGGLPPSMIDPNAGIRYAPGAPGGGPVTAPGAAGAGESAIAPGAAGSTETAIAPGAAGTAEKVIAPSASEGLAVIAGRVVAGVVAGAATVLVAGATIPGDSPLPEATPTPTSAELDAAFVRIAQREEARLREMVRNWDFSLIAAYQPGAMKAILRMAQSRPWAALSLLHKAYGRTLELMIDDALQTDDVTSGYFEHLGGANQADWRRYDGVLYDVCTTDTRAEHLARFYGERMRIYTHQGVPQFDR
jgi:RHS repeat-associated protein